MRPQNGLLVHVVSVGTVTPDMVWWKSKRIEVLPGSNDGEEIIVSLVSRETGLDELPGDGQGVVRLEVESAGYCFKNS
jgi:hypothetical protein